MGIHPSQLLLLIFWFQIHKIVCMALFFYFSHLTITKIINKIKIYKETDVILSNLGVILINIQDLIVHGEKFTQNSILFCKALKQQLAMMSRWL